MLIVVSSSLGDVSTMRRDRAVCGLGNTGQATVDVGSGNRYWILAGQSLLAEGSAGLNSSQHLPTLNALLAMRWLTGSRYGNTFNLHMKRLLTVLLLVGFLMQTSPAAGELLENALHYAQEGHGAHALAEAPTDGDDHDPIDAEHGCSDTLHLCSCCASLSISLSGQMQTQPQAAESMLARARRACLPPGIASPVDHPPQL